MPRARFRMIVVLTDHSLTIFNCLLSYHISWYHPIDHLDCMPSFHKTLVCQTQGSWWRRVVLLLIDRQEKGVQAEGEAPKIFLNIMFCHVVFNTDDSILEKSFHIPRVGRAEISFTEVSIHGRRAETLVKMAKSCWLHSRPSLLLTIPTRTWLSSSFTAVSGPPLHNGLFG